jgi:D-arginine dehydrogenase
MADVVVIGGGIAGMSAAWRLATTGARVTLLEAEDQCGSHSTARSAATFTAAYGSAAVRRVTEASRGFLDQPPPGFCDVALTRPRGCMTIAPPEDAALLQAELAQAAPGVLEPVEPSEALRMVPVLRPESVGYAIIEPGCRDIDVDALFNGYRRGLLAAGGQIVTGARVDRIGRDGLAWWVDTPAGRFSGAKLVNAAGAWSDEVARKAGVRPLGLVPMRRTAVLVDAPGSATWPMVQDAAETLYFKPDAGRLMVSPADATPTDPCDAQPEELDVAIAMDRLQRATTLDVRQVSHRWAGLRTFTPDHTPVVGEDAGAPGFIWLAGQGGYGVMTSPAMSALAAAAVSGIAPPGDLGPDRAGLGR